MKQCKLYSLVTTTDEKKTDLYVRRRPIPQGQAVRLKAGETMDFFTYFNSFSVKKWKAYTTLQNITIKLQLHGTFAITCMAADTKGMCTILTDVTNGENYEHTFAVNEIQKDILGFSLVAKEDGATYYGGGYYGEFASYQCLTIGIGICTFKREEYVNRTIEVLQEFQQKNDWLHVIIVDNGSTLAEQEQDKFRIVHNRNYGGSGGFTRAIIEYVDKREADYVLLMDDDIILETSTLERSYSLLCGLKNEYYDSFLCGAMLSMEEPTKQYENTAYWKRIRLYGLGKGFDMSQTATCAVNENLHKHMNQYGAWWYCCIPVHRIEQIGYPLPLFIKGDDMEYGIRNVKPVLTMNGIAVWHQSFIAKMNDVVNYYSDRNMLIINNFAEGCNWGTFSVAIIGRIVKRLIQLRLNGLRMLYFALKDYNKGLSIITSIGGDEKMRQIQERASSPANVHIVPGILMYALKTILCYPVTHKKYMRFREKKLADSKFWKEYLRLRG